MRSFIRHPGSRAALLLLMSLGLPGSADAATFTLSGFVRNEAGVGVANVDLNLIDVCTGTNVFLVNDKSLANGSFSIVVNQATYDVEFTLPVGSTLAASNQDAVVINANVNLGVVTLHPGFVVSGVVRNGNAVGLASAFVNFADAATGARFYVPGNVTDAAGNYAVRVAAGAYDVQYRPPSGTPYVTGLRKGLVVATDVAGLVNTLPAGIQLTGTVVNLSSQPIKDADLNFTDTCTGDLIPTAHDNTDSTGAFSVVVPAGTYTVRIAPPACTALSAELFPDRTVSGPAALGSIVLHPAFPVTGRVLDPASQPVADADLNAFDATTGAHQGTSRDNAGAAGTFSIYLPGGMYDIDLRPPASRDLLVVRVPAVSVTGATALGDQFLPAGIPVTGKVLGPGSAPLLNVDVDVVDAASGAAVRLAHSHTAADGSFRVDVPAGTYDFRFIPPACSPLAPADLRSVPVTVAKALPTVSLVTGVRLSGFVRDTLGSPVANADLDLFEPGTANQVFTAKDNTDATGHYDFVVPPGVYDLTYSPAVGSSLRPARRFAVEVTGDTVLSDTILSQGVIVSGRVLSASGGLALGGVELDFIAAGGGAPLFTIRDLTGADGSYSVVVTAGSWDIHYIPPAGSGLSQTWRGGVAASSNLTLSDTLLYPASSLSIASVNATSGTTAGGQTVTLTGAGFLAGAVVQLGKVTGSAVSVLSGTSLTVKTPPHPPGLVDVVVIKSTGQVATLASAFRYQEPATPIALTEQRSGNDIVLTWGVTGQASYTIFRNTAPNGFGDFSILKVTAGTTFTDLGAAALPGVLYYGVY